MLEVITIPIVIVAFVYNNLATDYVLKKIRQNRPDDYALILGERKHSWIEHQSLFFPLRDVPLVFKVYGYIITRRNRQIVTPTLWVTFSVSFLLIVIAVLKVLILLAENVIQNVQS